QDAIPSRSRATSSNEPPSLISRCTSRMVVTRSRRAATCPSMYTPRSYWSASATGTSGVPAPSARSTPLAATRSRPAVIRSSSALLRWARLRDEVPAGVGEALRKRGRPDADLVARARLQEDRRLASQRLGLESWDDRAGRDAFLGEEIRRAHQHADLHPARRE